LKTTQCYSATSVSFGLIKKTSIGFTNIGIGQICLVVAPTVVITFITFITTDGPWNLVQIMLTVQSGRQYMTPIME
jgi:hypothetical protein